MAARIVLVRHGEAQAGVTHIIGGDKGCRGLTDRGREQAGALRDRLARTGELQPDAIYSSTLPRALQTAEIFAAAFPHITDIRRERDLCEQVPGECDGMRYEDALAKYAPAADGPDVALSPGGESSREFDARVRVAIRRLAAGHPDETVLVSTHGGFVGAACMYAVGAPGLAEVYPFRLWPSNTGLTVFAAAPTEPPWLLERYNDIAHLS